LSRRVVGTESCRRGFVDVGAVSLRWPMARSRRLDRYSRPLIDLTTRNHNRARSFTVSAALFRSFATQWYSPAPGAVGVHTHAPHLLVWSNRLGSVAGLEHPMPDLGGVGRHHDVLTGPDRAGGVLHRPFRETSRQSQPSRASVGRQRNQAIHAAAAGWVSTSMIKPILIAQVSPTRYGRRKPLRNKVPQPDDTVLSSASQRAARGIERQPSDPSTMAPQRVKQLTRRGIP